MLFWYKKWNKVCQEENGRYSWFVDGKTNIAENILRQNPSKLALIWEGQNGETRKFTYKDLKNQVNRFACHLKKTGIKKGAVVALFLPKIPETLFLMLACAKIGAVHMFVFSGFGHEALKERLLDSQAKLIITTKNYLYRDKIINSLETVKKAGAKNIMLVENFPQKYKEIKTEIMDASDPLFILYTSGTTSKPKKIVHNHGGYMVGAYQSAKEVFQLKKDSIFFCTADFGWITGHTYITYGPLLNGATVIIYEGPPDFPSIDIWWKIIARHHATHFYTSPTAIRSLMRFGSIKDHDFSSLKCLGSVGEPLDKQSKYWFEKHVGNGKLDVKDTWWQTETGMILLVGKPFNNIKMEIVDKELIINSPWPAMWKNITLPYHTGDLAKKLKNGTFQILGRKDDAINVAGHRLSSAEIESCVNTHPKVCESAAIGLPDIIKGEKIKIYAVVLKNTQANAIEIINHVRKHFGSLATPSEVEFVESLPKTRSGKIMRRLLRAQSQHLPVGDVSTLDS